MVVPGSWWPYIFSWAKTKDQKESFFAPLFFRFRCPLEVFLGSLVPFRTHLVGLFTFYLVEKCHYFLLVCAFSPALTCAFLALLYTNNTFQVVEEPPALEAGPSGGQRPVPRPGQAPEAQVWPAQHHQNLYYCWSGWGACG